MLLNYSFCRCFYVFLFFFSRRCDLKIVAGQKIFIIIITVHYKNQPLRVCIIHLGFGECIGGRWQQSFMNIERVFPSSSFESHRHRRGLSRPRVHVQYLIRDTTTTHRYGKHDARSHCHTKGVCLVIKKKSRF